MSLNIYSQNHQSANKFGNFFLSLKIHNYPMTFFIPDCKIISPEFQVKGRQITTWQLILRPCIEENGRRQFVFRLHRLDNEPNATIVWTDWKITVIMTNDTVLCAKTGHFFFGGNSWHESVVCNNPGYIFEKLNTLQSDWLRFNLHVIVNHGEAIQSFEVTHDPGLKSLSRDLFALYKSGDFFDIIMATRQENIRAHKAILLCRAAYFRDLFTPHNHIHIVDCRIFSYETINSVLSYLYSGKLEYVLGNPSIEIFECAVRFGAEEVRLSYALDFLQVESKTDVVKIYDEWLISNFKTRDENEILSKTFTVSNLVVRFNLCPEERGGNGNSVKVFAKIRCDPEKRYIFFTKLGIINPYKKLVCISNKEVFAKNNAFLQLCDWSNSVLNSNVSVNGTLNVSIKFEVCETKAHWKYSLITTLYSPTPNVTARSYSRLSNDIRSLITTGYLSDFRYFSEYMKCDAHKCVLGARSYEIKNRIKSKHRRYLCHRKMERKIIIILMNYLYSGILKKCNVKDAMKLYDVADYFLLPVLKVLTSQFLQNSLTLENVSDILIFAHEENDRALKLAVFKFFCFNSEAVNAQQHFQQLKTSHMTLYNEACEFATKNNPNFPPT